MSILNILNCIYFEHFSLELVLIISILYLYCNVSINMYIDELHPLRMVCGQVMNLILTLKKSYLQFAATERWSGWGEVVHYAQLFAHIRKVIEQRLFVDLKVDLLHELLASLIEEFSQRH